ncbi:hypothetical protein QNH26_16955 [Peribacillus frigoritolerans]|uniref:hypothetical protein n=1 Tax=Peribacillus frigoritolerans TaxID=450367 RepID=UPI0024C104B7|nr:hypothetical protein [Peribacillus frigoritolerans]WHX65378.1 hypothetical protein QNH26_16955 [Peribacillus frigoritolerans]
MTSENWPIFNKSFVISNLKKIRFKLIRNKYEQLGGVQMGKETKEKKSKRPREIAIWCKYMCKNTIADKLEVSYKKGTTFNEKIRRPRHDPPDTYEEKKGYDANS